MARAHRGDCTVLVVRGDPDFATRGRILAAARGPLQESPGRALVLDLSGVGFMASVGAAELIMRRDECLALDVEVRVVVGQSRSVQLLVNATGLHQLFAIFGSVDDALAAGQPRRA